MAIKWSRVICVVVILIAGFFAARSAIRQSPPPAGRTEPDVVYVAQFPPPPPPEGPNMVATPTTPPPSVATPSAPGTPARPPSPPPRDAPTPTASSPAAPQQPAPQHQPAGPVSSPAVPPPVVFDTEVTSFTSIHDYTGMKKVGDHKSIGNKNCPSIRQNHTHTMQACRAACKEVGCNAVNINVMKMTCVYRACKNPEDAKPVESVGWAAYTLVPEFKEIGFNQAVLSTACPGIGSSMAYSLEDCEGKCRSRPGCTAVNVHLPLINCIQRKCSKIDDVPLVDNQNWLAYIIE